MVEPLLDLRTLPLPSSLLDRTFSFLLSSVCIPYFSSPFQLYSCFRFVSPPFLPNPLIVYQSLLIPRFSLFPVISCRFPCLRFLYQSVTYLPRPLHFGVVPRYDISPLPPSYFISIYWLIVLVLSAPSPFGFYCSLFPILVFPISPSPVLGTLPRSSHELRLFYRPIALDVYLFISYIFYLIFFFLLSRCLYTWFPLSPLPAPVRNLPSRSVFLHSSTGNYSAPASCHLQQLLYINR